jgi:hypothetical protein
MVGIITPRLHAAVPRPETGWFEYAYAVLADGSLARLQVSFDVRTARQDHRRKMHAQEPAGPSPLYPSDTRGRITVLDGTTLSPGPEFAFGALFPMFDRLTDASWFVADARCTPGAANARVIDRDGSVRRTFAVGDGIEHLQCDRAGGIWVAYFDEGIFGDPLSASGLNRFDAQGARTWAYDGPIADCYTLNVAADAAWACPYTDWPILKIGFDGATTSWPNSRKAGAKLLAVDGDLVVLLGGYQDEARHGVLFRLGDGHIDCVGEFALGLDEDPRALPMAAGRGAAMHFVQGDAWLKLSVSEIARELM